MRNYQRNGISVAAALLLSNTAVNAAGIDIEALQRRLDAQSQQLQVQSEQINALSQQLNAMKASPAAAAADASSAPAAVSGVGSFPGSYIIPGTNTSFKVGGFADMAVTYDANSTVGQAGFMILNGFQPKSITSNSITSLGSSKIALPGTPEAKEIGRLQWSPRWSRLALETRTPTKYGEIKLYVESDFEGDGLTANKSTTWSVSPRLRQAYGAIGNLSVGQMMMLVNDFTTAPESLDNNAFVGYEAGNRIPAIQYHWNLDAAQRNQISVAAESAYNDFLGADGGNFQSGGGEGETTDNLSHIPDFSAKIASNGGWGRIFAAGDIREIGVDSFGVAKVYGNNAARVVHDSVVGGAFTTGGKVFTTLGDPRNAVSFRVTGGQGAGRMVVMNAPSAVVDNHGKLQLQQQGGFGISYQHWFSDTWRANATYGRTHVWNKSAYQSTQGLWKQTQEAEINLIWAPTKYATVGVGYMWISEDAVQGYCLTAACNGGTAVPGATRAWSGTSAYDNRFSFHTRIGF